MSNSRGVKGAQTPAALVPEFQPPSPLVKEMADQGLSLANKRARGLPSRKVKTGSGRVLSLTGCVRTHARMMKHLASRETMTPQGRSAC